MKLPDGIPTGFTGEIYYRHEQFARGEWERHSHAWGQFNFVSQGVMHIEIDGQHFLSPPRHAIWIPPFAEHFSYANMATVYRSVYLSLPRCQDLPDKPCSVSVGSVLRAILDDLAARDVRSPVSPADLRMSEVAIDQILGATYGDTYLPSGNSMQVNIVLEELHRNPADRRSNAELAAHVNTTARTLERKCQLELGMALNEWRQRLKLLRAIESLDGGAQVQRIADELGFATSSAFIVMFKRLTGMTPDQYRVSGQR
ncbi:AraC family transcriptional regulator [Burkholderia perseverans]|uniref:AraC family transcriptional regulator n=1 Tax=Burkholderia perseverans TaxID=2615214 RepID=UPI001FEE29D5|nr:helix-turn-helix transcriptional regulator [Burkholderia perseverans]